MSIKVNDLVVVIDKGDTYDTYRGLLVGLFEKSIIDSNLKHAYGCLPIEGQTYIVVAITEHENSGDKIAVIHNDNQHVYLIGVEGLSVK